ncbi:MAG TPA: N-6 DNA methylase [Stellaceae bacterium]|nr:N-6 DNA methylase [Stellaceae bacterium]
MILPVQSRMRPPDETHQRQWKPATDHMIARSLSSQLAEGNRAAFARGFTYSVVSALSNARGVSLRTPDAAIAHASLSADASAAALNLGRNAAALADADAAYVIGTIYAAALPEAHRGAYGIFYTPPELVERLLVMAEDAGVLWSRCRALDPSCGGGAFIIPMALRMAAELDGADPAFILQQIGTRLRGYDIDAFGAWLAQALLEIALHNLAGRAGRQVPVIVEVRDALILRESDAAKYDLVIGNPPYGRISLEPNRRTEFSRSVYGHANLYGLFTDAAIRWAKPGGIIAYVTPTSMLSGLYYKALRELLAAEAPPLAINFVTERDGVFTDVLQETMLAAYRKGGMAVSGQVGFIDFDDEHCARQKKAGRFALPQRAERPWLLPRTPAQAVLTRRLRSMPYRLADYGYGVSTGPLVWNRYKGQLQAAPTADGFPVIWAESVASDGRFELRSERRNHSPWFAAKRPKDDWLIVTQSCVLLQRTTAKEQPRRLIAAELPQSLIRRHGGVVVENHLNMVRPICADPLVSVAVIAGLLKTSTLDAAFRCINGSVAVSAYELEQLPLPGPVVMAKLAKLVASGAARQEIEMLITAAYDRTDAASALRRS